MNSQPNSASTRSMVFDGGGAPATTTRTRPAPGMLSPRWRRGRPARGAPAAHPSGAGNALAARAAGRRGVEHRGDHRRRAVEDGHPLRLDASQDLLTVDLADDHLP